MSDILSTYSVSEQLYRVFVPLYRIWQAQSPKDSALWAAAGKTPLAQLLEEDLVMVGRFFAHADDLGMRSELALVAELVAIVKQMDGAEHRQGSIDDVTDHLLKRYGHRLSQFHARDAVFAPTSWRIGQWLYAQHLITDDTLAALRTAWQSVANLMMLRDGLISNDEQQRLKEFDATFSR